MLVSNPTSTSITNQNLISAFSHPTKPHMRDSVLPVHKGGQMGPDVLETTFLGTSGKWKTLEFQKHTDPMCHLAVNPTRNV